MIDDCSALDRGDTRLAGDKLAAYNRIMTSLRIQAKESNIGSFHRFFQRAIVEKRVIKYLTTAFDAIEVQNKRVAEGKVLRVHGDNSILRCCSPGCPGLTEREVMDLDDELLSGKELLCLHCTQTGK